jgi:DNA-binding NtrC family response regulator
MAHLLIVDDEPSLCQMLEIAFRKDGHKVDTVGSGQAALKKIDAQAYDLVISDIRMPDLSGIDLLKRVREAGHSVAFILITAVPTMATAVQALNLGAYRYVIKTDRLVEEARLVVKQALEELALREENIQLRRELREEDEEQGAMPQEEPVVMAPARRRRETVGVRRASPKGLPPRFTIGQQLLEAYSAP